MSKEKLVLCKVIRSGFVINKEEMAIGDEIEMTESQAKRFSGKLQLDSVIKAKEADEAKSLKGFNALRKENETLIAEAESMEERIAELENQLTAYLEDSKAKKK